MHTGFILSEQRKIGKMFSCPFVENGLRRRKSSENQQQYY